MLIAITAVAFAPTKKERDGILSSLHHRRDPSSFLGAFLLYLLGRFLYYSRAGRNVFALISTTNSRRHKMQRVYLYSI